MMDTKTRKNLTYIRRLLEDYRSMIDSIDDLEMLQSLRNVLSDPEALEALILDVDGFLDHHAEGLSSQ